MKFNVGDRIIAYYPYNEKVKGVVMGVYDHVNSISILCDDGACMNFHPKQCRRVVRKKNNKCKTVESASSLQPYRCDNCHGQMSNPYPYCYSCALKIANETELSEERLQALEKRMASLEKEGNLLLRFVLDINQASQELTSRMV